MLQSQCYHHDTNVPMLPFQLYHLNTTIPTQCPNASLLTPPSQHYHPNAIVMTLLSRRYCPNTIIIMLMLPSQWKHPAATIPMQPFKHYPHDATIRMPLQQADLKNENGSTLCLRLTFSTY